MKEFLFLIVVLLAIACGLLIILISFTACDEDPECQLNDTRCNGHVLELCNADEQWQMLTDCQAFGPDQTCCMYGGEPDCRLPRECDR
jgi:hypothetical protein